MEGDYVGEALRLAIANNSSPEIISLLCQDYVMNKMDSNDFIIALNQAAGTGNIEVAVKIAERLTSTVNVITLKYIIIKLAKYSSQDSIGLVVKLIDENTDKDHIEEQTCNAIVAASRANNI
jgi:hypothetical protein